MFYVFVARMGYNLHFIEQPCVIKWQINDCNTTATTTANYSTKDVINSRAKYY